MNIIFKIIFQILFALAILPLSVWLFTLIPTPSDLLQGTFVLGIIMYPLALAFYVSAVGILAVSTWNLIAFIFKDQDDDEEEYQQKGVTPTASKHKKYNYQPSIKQQTQSLDTTAQITGLAPARPKNMQKKNDSLLFSTFKVVSWITGISFALAFAVLAFFIYTLKLDSDKRELKAYKTLYETEDYNDSRIIAYRHALEDASKQLIDSEDMYDTFEADIKREIALHCISIFIKEHNDTKENQAYTLIKNFKLNARNHYANTKDIVKKSIKREKFLRDTHGVYSYPYSGGYGLSYSAVGLERSCKNMISVDVIYKKFMPFYIKGQESKLDDFRIRAITDSSVKKYHKKQKKWLQTLHEKHPK